MRLREVHKHVFEIYAHSCAMRSLQLDMVVAGFFLSFYSSYEIQKPFSANLRIHRDYRMAGLPGVAPSGDSTRKKSWKNLGKEEKAENEVYASVLPWILVKIPDNPGISSRT